MIYDRGWMKGPANVILINEARPSPQVFALSIRRSSGIVGVSEWESQDGESDVDAVSLHPPPLIYMTPPPLVLSIFLKLVHLSET